MLKTFAGLERADKRRQLCLLRSGVINEKTALLIHFENKFQNFIFCLFFHFTTKRNSRSAGELVVTFLLPITYIVFILITSPSFYYLIFLQWHSAEQVPPLAPNKNNPRTLFEDFFCLYFYFFFFRFSFFCSRIIFEIKNKKEERKVAVGFSSAKRKCQRHFALPLVRRKLFQEKRLFFISKYLLGLERAVKKSFAVKFNLI